MSEAFLTEPSKVYQSSFEDYVLAYQRINDQHYIRQYGRVLEDFDKYLEELTLAAKQATLTAEVPTSTFWLIDEEHVVGVVRIRHQEVESAGHIGYDISPDYRRRGYGTLLLKLTLEEAQKIGHKEAIVTCSISNIYSRKIIEKNKGRLLGVIYDPEEKESLYRYSIALSAD